jgi:hypothetical protein
MWSTNATNNFFILQNLTTCFGPYGPSSGDNYRNDIQYVEVEVSLRPTVSRPVRLGIGPPYETLDQILSCSFFC